MRQARDLGYNRHHQGEGLLDLNSTLQQLTAKRRSVFIIKGDRQQALRWAAAILLLIGAGFVASFKPWTVDSPHPEMVQTARASTLAKQLERAGPPFAAETEDQEIRTMMPGPRYSADQHDRMYTRIFTTLSEVDSVVQQEEQR